MAIGNWGKKIKFETNANKVLTFSDFKLTAGGRWASHGIIGKKPKQEFLGPDLRTVTMKIRVDAQHGVKPFKTLKAIRDASEAGTLEYLYIGGKKICECKVHIVSVSENWDEIWSKGELIRADVSVTFSE